ncbi:MAG: tRNA (N(6)-L-threonylcarbamoyladenosine(37)-C(2))-methylthiotransferase MtaB [Candidatus Margulisiibacteriota bacterium]
MTKIAFYTLGCKSNQYETEAMKSQCPTLEIVPFNSKADIYVINTCTVTSDADKKSRQAIRKALKNDQSAQVVVTGCYSELCARELEKEFPGIRLLKIQDKKELLKHIYSHTKTPRPSRWGFGVGIYLPKENSQCHFKEGRVRRNLMVEDGCENFCSYCIVPYARGKVRTLPIGEVVEEANKMVDSGCREIVLTGINLGEFKELPALITELNNIASLSRVRLSSIEPMYVTDELIAAVAGTPKTCRHLHVPLQSGDDGVLKAMNRNYCLDDYKKIIEKARKNIPECAITTDIIVGLPGEGPTAFENTKNAVEEIGFSRIHIFTYSPRKGTAAAKMPEQVDPKTKKQRYDILNKSREKLMRQFAEKYLEKEVEVLIEQPGEGLTHNYIRVKSKEINEDIGKIITIKITSVEKDFCIGENV